MFASERPGNVTLIWGVLAKLAATRSAIHLLTRLEDATRPRVTVGVAQASSVHLRRS